MLSFSEFQGQRDALNDALPAALAALSTVLAHSFRLNKLPSLKTKLWDGVLENAVLLLIDNDDSPEIKDWLWVVEDESFPVVTFDMNFKQDLAEIHANALVAFFTTPPAHEMDEELFLQCEQFAPNEISVQLRFGFLELSLSPDSLRLVENILDRVYASPGRQFAVKALHMKYQQMHTEHLEVIVDIVKKNSAVYYIDDCR